MNKLSNVMAWKRNASKRVQRALEELLDSLNPQRDSHPVPVPVRIPVKGNNGPGLGPQRFSTLCTGLGIATARRSQMCPRRFFSTFMPRTDLFFRFNVHNKPRLFSKYKWFFNLCHSNRFFSSRCARGQSLKNCLLKGSSGFMYGNFSQSSQNAFRLKLQAKNLHLTYRSIFCQVKDMLSNFDQQAHVASMKPKGVARTIALYDENKPKTITNHNIILNRSCSQENHKMTLELARADSTATSEERVLFDHVSTGSYIEFPINFDISIPDETILNDEVLEELLVNVKRFQTKLAEFKNDIVCLFELGELPIKYVKERQVLRVYFPNCDYHKLELLCREKNVSGGYIYEDFGDESLSSAEPAIPPIVLGMNEDNVLSSRALWETDGSDPLSTSASTVVSKDDILSSSLYDSDDSCSTASSCSFEDDIMLSSEIVHPLSNDEVVRLNYVALPQANRVSIHSDEIDDYYWVAA